MVRAARIDDAEAIASVHIASSDEAYAPLAAEWASADTATRAARWEKSIAETTSRLPLVLVAEDTLGRVIGFVSGGHARRTEPAVPFEVYVIHVHPAHRGRAIGDALWIAACRELRGPQLAALYVDTLAELRCCSFYERHGGQLIERRRTDFHGATRTHVTYRWTDGAPNWNARESG